MNVLAEIKEVSSAVLQNYSRLPSRDEKASVLNSLMRYAAISNYYGIKKCLNDKQYEKISIDSGISYDIVKSIINAFLLDLSLMRAFYRDYVISWDPNLKRLERKVRCYLHGLHRLAPVFDFKRARVNTKILLRQLEKRGFWPKISTQACLIIFITDVLDENVNEFNRLIQSNVRDLCGCSAYAFHRSRNKLGINP